MSSNLNYDFLCEIEFVDLRNQVTDVIVPLPPLQSKEKFLKNKIYVRHNFKDIIEMETSMNLI